MQGLSNFVAGISYASLQKAGTYYRELSIPLTQIAGPQEKRLRFRASEYLTSTQVYAGYYEMNYLEAEPSRHSLLTHYFLFKYEFFKKCHSASRRWAMGDELLCFRIRKWIIRNLEIIPLLSASWRIAFPFSRRDPCGESGTSSFFRSREAGN